MKLVPPSVLIVVVAYFVGIPAPCSSIRHTFATGAISVQEAAKIRAKYPDRIPVVVARAAKSHIADIDKKIFLVPSSLTIAQFMYIIRKRIQLPPEKDMFLFGNKVLPTTSSTMGAVYEEHKAENGFLYIYYSGENIFA